MFCRPSSLVGPVHPHQISPLPGDGIFLQCSAPSFLCTSEAVEDLSNHSWAFATNAASHPFLSLVDTPPDLGNDAHYGIIMMYLHTSITTSLYPIYYYPHLLCLCLHWIFYCPSVGRFHRLTQGLQPCLSFHRQDLQIYRSGQKHASVTQLIQIYNKGDATWSSWNSIIGWLLYTLNLTVL